MESLNPKFSLYASKNESNRTDAFFFPLSEVSKGAVSLVNSAQEINMCKCNMNNIIKLVRLNHKGKSPGVHR